jgi:hypothetical protein
MVKSVEKKKSVADQFDDKYKTRNVLLDSKLSKEDSGINKYFTSY